VRAARPGDAADPGVRRVGTLADVIAQVPLRGGPVEAVEVWGGQAQVRLAGDTVFLTETPSGWRVTAAACEPRGEMPYDCRVEGP
jgi:hypothetical protein